MAPFVFVLGVAQDGGHPQPGCTRTCCAGTATHLPSSIAIVDGERRWLLDATPALPEQLRRLDATAPGTLDGVFLTHAHIGHYAGLVHLGREVMGARGMPLWVMPRMAAFLASNGPWDQLVRLGNVDLRPADRVDLGRVTVEALPVQHRDEYSETVAFRVTGPSASILYLPDIDAWTLPIEELVATVDAAWIDGTFWSDGELGRDMSEIPHPRISTSIERFRTLPATERAKLRFTHLNHTNPALDPSSAQAEAVRAAGMRVAEEGERFAI